MKIKLFNRINLNRMTTYNRHDMQYNYWCVRSYLEKVDGTGDIWHNRGLWSYWFIFKNCHNSKLFKYFRSSNIKNYIEINPFEMIYRPIRNYTQKDWWNL